MSNYQDAPEYIKNFITYLVAIRGRSQLTASEYYLDLRNFFRYILQKRDLVSKDTPFQEISITSIDLPLIRSITSNDIYDYLMFMSKDRPTQQNSSETQYGVEKKTLARKTSALRSFYKYLTEKVYLMEHNPTLSIEPAKAKKTLPKYLTLTESVELLSNIDGSHKERDFCIITLFLNCGLRVSELAGLNLSDRSDSQLRILGKGGKERIVYLNDACNAALEAYLPVRLPPKVGAQNALFISAMGNRINVQTVKWLVKKHLNAAGLQSKNLSVHKLRHTAATLMYQNGVDVRVLQEVLGHENLNTTQIYTHISNENIKDAAEKNPLANITIAPKKKK